MRRDIELAWAAGFYDGEGSMGCYAGSRLQLTVAQKRYEPLKRFQLAVDGHGTISPPSQRGVRTYRVYGPHAQREVMRLWPYLCEPKRDQALRALLGYAFRPIRPGHLRLCWRGHDLAQPGSTYVARDGGRECLICRNARRHGELPPRQRFVALDARLGVREYELAVQT